MANQREIDRLHAQRRKLEDRISDLEGEQRRRQQSKLVGRVFEYQNGYSLDQRWPLYIRIDAIDEDGWLTTFQFEEDCHGEFFIRPASKRLTISDDYSEISRGEFDAAWAHLLAKIQERA